MRKATRKSGLSWFLLAFFFVVGLTLPGLAWDSARPQVKVPEHVSSWVEAKKPNVRNLLLWKFLTEQDHDQAIEDLLDTGGLDEFLTVEDGPLPSAAADGIAPKLAGGALVKSGVGRFGGGLVLDGTGVASATVPLAMQFDNEGGFTLDFWFNPDNAQEAPETLFALCDRGGKALIAAVLGSDRKVDLIVDGVSHLQVPVYNTVDGWHHLRFVLSGSLRMATPALTIDGTDAGTGTLDLGSPIPWLDGVPARLASIHIGGIPKTTDGLKGVVDEIRLTKGVMYLYPWNLGTQELTRQTENLELRSPFFRGSQVLSRFRFDGSLEPEVFAGRSWTGKADAECFKPGLASQALDLSRIGQAGFEIQGNDFLLERNGTIEFWFRPLDWNNFYVGGFRGEGVVHQWLMSFREPGESDYQASKDLEVSKGRSSKVANQRLADGSSAVAWTQIHPGTWTHVLVTLASNGAQTVYLNGQKQKFHQVGLVLRAAAIKTWQEKTGGDEEKDARRWTFVNSPTLVDEFSVFGWAMSPEEAWNAYARWMPKEVAEMKPLPIFWADFDYFAHSYDMVEKLNINLACLPVGDTKPASADCELRTTDGQVLLDVKNQKLAESGSTLFTLKQPLDFGRYLVTVRSRDADGKVLKEEQLEYVRERPEWLGNTLGEDRTVPPPWTPIALEDSTLRVIGRELDLGKNGLPAAIQTLGKPILAGPVVVRAAGSGGKDLLVGNGVTFSETALDRVAWTASLAGAGLTADLDAWMEFDGLLYCAITLKPASGTEVSLDELDIDFPLSPETATQLLANGGGKNFRASWIATAVPQGTGSVWNSLEKPYPAFGRAVGVNNYMPHIWIGADDVGLYFGGENDKGWTVDGPKPAQEILRKDDAVVFRMNVIREPTIIPDAGRRFHFVMLPTPAKPEPSDWRKQMTSGGVNFGSCDSFGGFDMKTDLSDPQPRDTFRLEPCSWEHAAAMAPQSRAKWGRCILYADASWPQLGPAFSDWSHDMWCDTGKLAWTPEFEDYAVWAINEYLKRGLIDGVYWDDVSVGSTVLLSSTAYEHAGSKNGRRVGFTALAQRRVNMRLWRLFLAAKKEPCIWAHMTVCYEVPIFSFCRYLSNCEFTTGVNFPGKRDAMNMWSPETLRLLGGSAKWGTGYQNLTTLPRTLPDTGVAKQWQYPQARTETGLYLTNDQMGPADGLGQVLVRERIFDGPVRAYPWWKAAEVVKVTAPEGATVRAGVYVNEGRAMVIVANWDREEREVVIELKPGTVPGLEQGVTWRDLDPGLEPPEAVAASAEEIKQVQVGAVTSDILDNGDNMLDDVSLNDELEGTTPEGRSQQRLKLRGEGDQARIVIRPRDYRVLEAKPKR